MKILVEEVIKKIDLTRENMMFAATVANNYKVQFEEISLAVSRKCVQFLDKTTRNSSDVFSLVEETLRGFPGATLHILLELKKVKDMKMPGDLTYLIFWKMLSKVTFLYLLLKSKMYLLQPRSSQAQ